MSQEELKEIRDEIRESRENNTIITFPIKELSLESKK